MKKAIFALLSAIAGVFMFSAVLLAGTQMLVYFVCFLIGVMIA